MTARGWGSSRQTLRNARKTRPRRPRPRCPGRAPVRRLGSRFLPVLHDVGRPSPTSEGTQNAVFARLGIEPVQHVGAASGCRTGPPGAIPFAAPQAQPVLGIDPDLQMNEARCQWRRHAVHHPAVGLAVAAGDQRGAVGQLVFADLAVEHQLIERRLHHLHRGRQLFQVDEPAAGIVGGRQESRRRPAGAVGAVAPRDAAQVHGVEQERPDVDILAAGIGGDLLGDGALGAARSSPQDHRLAGLDQQREGGGEFARAQRVVGGDGVGIGHGQDSGIAGMRRRGTPGPRPSPRPERRSAHRVAGCGDGAPRGWPAPGRRVAAAPTSGPVGRGSVRPGLRSRAGPAGCRSAPARACPTATG